MLRRVRKGPVIVDGENPILRPPEAFRATLTDDGVALSGEIDAATCDVLRDAIDAADEVYRDGPIRLDMTDVSFMDSTCLTILIKALKTTVNGVVVVRPSERVQRVLELAGLYERFVASA